MFYCECIVSPYCLVCFCFVLISFWPTYGEFLSSEAFLFVTNFAAPSLLKSEIVPCVLNLVGHMMSSHAETSAGVFLSPTFIWKGTLFQEEFGLLRTLSSAGCVVDTNFQLLFDIKSKVVSWQHIQ